MVDLVQALAPLHLTLADLARSAEQVILFGSRAAGIARAGSDWDLLVIGSGRSRSVPALDLVYVSPRDLASGSWLDSELAGHVARWGRWIYGSPDWIGQVGRGPLAAAHKGQRVASRIAALERAWNLLGPAHQRKHHTLVRRDLQRHELLSRGEAVPPSALLDEAWRSCIDRSGELMRLAERAAVCSVFFEAVFAEQGRVQE
jgi:hypothetical protein